MRCRGMIVAALLLLAGPVSAQVRSIDPNQGIDQDLSTPASRAATGQGSGRSSPPQADDRAPLQTEAHPSADAPPYRADNQTRADSTTQAADTYRREDLIGAGEGVFGKGAEGLAGIIERILKDQGQPNAYIAGREASGAFVVGLRYGSGVLNHKVEGQPPVYWTGPSIGFDVGGNAAKTFVLVYNLDNPADLFRRFGAGEGQAYFIGGFNVSYLRRGSIVLIPVRLGVGLRLGINGGYMKFSHHQNWLPF